MRLAKKIARGLGDCVAIFSNLIKNNHHENI